MQHQYGLLLNPTLLTRSDFAAKSTTIWLSLYRVEKILTKSKYLKKKLVLRTHSVFIESVCDLLHVIIRFSTSN